MSAPARRIFRSSENHLYLSAASAWEIALKHSAGRLELSEAPAVLLPRERERHGIEPLTVDETDALGAGRLPDLHRDPFDRLLVFQAIHRGMTILTPDDEIAKYPVRTAW